MRRFLRRVLAVLCWSAFVVVIPLSLGVLAGAWGPEQPGEYRILWRAIAASIVALTVPVGIFFGACRASQRGRGGTPHLYPRLRCRPSVLVDQDIRSWLRAEGHS